MGNGVSGGGNGGSSAALHVAAGGTGEGQRFNSILAALPKLFSETTASGGKYLCTAIASANFNRVVFACTDAKQRLYQKDMSQEELEKIKEKIDPNRSIGWWQFFSALKHAFYHKKVSLMKDSPDEDASEQRVWKMIIELNFATTGRTSLLLKLRRTEENVWPYINENFLGPLFDFYSARIEATPRNRVEQLEKEIRMYKEKVAQLEKQAREENGSDEMNGYDEHGVIQAPIMSDEIVTIPAEKIMKFLKEIKKKLQTTKALSDTELESFNNVLQVISMDSLYNVEFSKQPPKDVDLQVLSYLKYKFTTDGEDRAKKRDKKEPMQLLSASEFLKSSGIMAQKTKQDIVSMFDKVDDWNFDVFSLDELTGGRTLFITSYTLFVKYDLLNTFNIDEAVLINFLREVESGYHHNAYHNAMHAADVLQVLHFIISKGGLIQYMSKEDIFAALLSAIIHDYDHPGLNNAFQVNAQSYLATLYNDNSVLENHHCAQAFELMRSKQCNIFHGMSKEQKRDIRESVIQMVLATDMSKHAKIVGKFKSRIETDTDFSSKEDVRLAMQIAIKMADVSNPSRPTDLYLRWTQNITEEFFKQGDKERELHMPISPLMDRTKPSLGKGQIAFMSYIVYPMFENFCELLPDMKFSLECIKKNKEYWETHDEIVLPTQ